MQTCTKTAPREACKRPECSQENQTNLFCAAGLNWRSKILFGIFPDANTTRLTNVIVVDRFVLKRRLRYISLTTYIGALPVFGLPALVLNLPCVLRRNGRDRIYVEAGGKPHRTLCRWFSGFQRPAGKKAHHLSPGTPLAR